MAPEAGSSKFCVAPPAPATPPPMAWGAAAPAAGGGSGLVGHEPDLSAWARLCGARWSLRLAQSRSALWELPAGAVRSRMDVSAGLLIALSRPQPVSAATAPLRSGPKFDSHWWRGRGCGCSAECGKIYILRQRKSRPAARPSGPA